LTPCISDWLSIVEGRWSRLDEYTALNQGFVTKIDATVEKLSRWLNQPDCGINDISIEGTLYWHTVWCRGFEWEEKFTSD
jgi:hypothetical protein